jgi:hypothetical protein
MSHRPVGPSAALPPEVEVACLEALADPSHEEDARYLHWIGGPFDPALFHSTVATPQRSLGRRATGSSGR